MYAGLTGSPTNAFMCVPLYPRIRGADIAPKVAVPVILPLPPHTRG